MTVDQAVTLVRELCGVEPVVEGTLITVPVETPAWRPTVEIARDRLGCRYFNWLSAIDWKDQGIEIVCRVENLASRLNVMLRTRLGAGVTRCPSLTGLYRGADWMERECFDMFGVTFDGHPDLRRILLDADWEGHPLRKDYAVDTPLAPYR
jgi:NADH-quinone oxidoreductase subunit C